MIKKKKIIRKKRKSTGFSLMPIMMVLSVLGLALTFYIGYRASISDRQLFSISLVALFAGLFYESFRISDSWKNVIFKFIVAYLFSFICFLPGKNDRVYVFENHIEIWPYYFIFFFTLISAFWHKDKVTAKLTEGITLFLSLSLIYWTVDYGFINLNNLFSKITLIIALFFSAFSIIHALAYFELSRNARLILSIWSTIILLAFAIDNIYRVYQNEDFAITENFSQGLYIGLQYFLLGVSAVYITQNYLHLMAFFPSKSGDYKNDLKEAVKDHLDRYTENQVLISHSVFCIVYTSTIYGLNYKYQILPRHTMIWLVFLTFPFFLKFLDVLKCQRIFKKES